MANCHFQNCGMRTLEIECLVFADHHSRACLFSYKQHCTTPIDGTNSAVLRNLSVVEILSRNVDHSDLTTTLQQHNHVGHHVQTCFGKMSLSIHAFDYQVESEENYFLRQYVMIALLCALQAS